MQLNLHELVQEMLTRSAMLDESIKELEEQTRQWAVADHTYRKQRAKAYLAAEGETVGHREAETSQATQRERFAAKLSEGLKVAALESVRSRRAQLSAVQSIANAVKAEAMLAGVGGP